MLSFKSFAGFGKEKHSLIESISTSSAPFTRAFGTRKFLEQVRGFEILASLVELVTNNGFSKAKIGIYFPWQFYTFCQNNLFPLLEFILSQSKLLYCCIFISGGVTKALPGTIQSLASLFTCRRL